MLLSSLYLTMYGYIEFHRPEQKRSFVNRLIKVEQSKVLIKEGGVQLLLTIVDTPGFGDAVDNSNCWQPVIDYIDSKFEDYLNAESRVNRRQMPDNRVQCCLYFIAPSGHGTHMQDLKDVTNNVHYENYRSRKLAAVTYNGVDNNKNKGQLTKSPLAQMEEERREHVAKMKKMEMEMEQVFEMKVKEKVQKLKDSEAELQRRHEQMKKNLEAQHKELEEKRRQFEDEKANWEAQQRILEQQNSSRTLEKNKKKGKIF
ncbi:cell division cycle 10 isoform 1 isoform 2-like protein [Camelus ferus]|nr:cell division cycle 10 isoform 1 isoform 2-like protein [Camelus ferus]